MMRGLSSVLLLGFATAMISGCGGESGKKKSRPADGGAGEPSQEAGAGGESNALGGSSASAGRGGSTGAAGGSAGTFTSGGRFASGGRSGAPFAGTGGAGGTGRATAGTGNIMPTAGQPSKREPEPPPDCETTGSYDGLVTCDFQFTCEDDHFYSTSCQSQTDDSWICYCKGGTSAQQFVIEGVAGIDACSAAAQACVSDLTEGEPTCELTGKSVDSSSCQTGETCSWEIELDSKATARAVKQYVATCGKNEVQDYSCQCSAGNNSQTEYLASAPAINPVCDRFLEFCKTEEEPEFTLAPTCAEQSASVSPSGCEMHQLCSPGADLGGGVTLLRPESYFANCEAPVSGVSRCFCNNERQSFSFEAQVTAADRLTCLAAIDACSAGTEIETSGTPTCTVSSQAAQPQTCDLDLACAQPVTFGGKSYVGHGLISVQCQKPAAGEPWWCSCATFEDSAIFELGEAPNGWDACSDAAVRCQEEVDVYIGPAGEFETPWPTPTP